ncbi:Bet1-like protein [Capsicum chinense]|uniref:Bet1-like protein n=1 Tax=Capsicum annuum TaxID=4072 RepID=A0A1U8FR00_CAPAN|nr:bet1-like protein At4g14600 [Capsicum annuum]XP_016558808.1 bet1-like protein At4g14600 [Capsicum annuum]XP_047262318.1 bet1-like protein At4g14600 [Capsicum annuum]XP_047262319.1 bet1-like protein At4g14600 [Capsicum annuum]PHU24947.1 Bet1-like protein [Capsicum chinense]KAF3624000.1 Bet1-like protein [Capsicum annuum]PHT89098.1 Bet1-like protein [Capsicum annuum]
MASRSHRGGDFYSAASYRCSDGLSTRQVGGSDEIQLRIDPMHGDLDDEITGLRKQVKQLRNVAQEIESEAKYQNDFINQLQMTLIKAQAGIKNNMRRLNRSIIQEGSNHVMHVVLFALLCFFVIYWLAKFSRR